MSCFMHGMNKVVICTNLLVWIITQAPVVDNSLHLPTYETVMHLNVQISIIGKVHTLFFYFICIFIVHVKVLYIYDTIFKSVDMLHDKEKCQL